MTSANPPKGRPRSEAAHRAILDAAFAILVERGYSGLTLEGVAARAGVGKATLYRRWTGRAALAVEAFFDATREELAFPETGSARGDFRAQIHALGALLRSSTGAAMAAMVSGGRGEPELARALGERWVRPRRVWGERRMTEAREAGALHDGVEIGAALGALYGPLYAPLLFGFPPLDEARVEAHLEIVLRGIFRA